MEHNRILAVDLSPSYLEMPKRHRNRFVNDEAQVTTDDETRSEGSTDTDMKEWLSTSLGRS